MQNKNMISRIITVKHTRTPQEALEATGRELYCNDEVVAKMPKGEDVETEVFFFEMSRWLTNDELAQEYRLRGLKPANPFTLAAVNENEPAFADDHPNITVWYCHEIREWCLLAFENFDGNQTVRVLADSYTWRIPWWFAGVRK